MYVVWLLLVDPDVYCGGHERRGLGREPTSLQSGGQRPLIAVGMLHRTFSERPTAAGTTALAINCASCEYFDYAAWCAQKGGKDITSPATPLPFGNRFPSADDRQIANQLAHVLSARHTGEVVLRVTEIETKRVAETTLTPAISDMFLDALRHIGSGDAVTIVPIHRILTTQQAADLLNISRPYLIKLLEAGDIAFTTVGRHRRIKAEDLFAYKAFRDQARSRALNELIGNDAELY